MFLITPCFIILIGILVQGITSSQSASDYQEPKYQGQTSANPSEGAFPAANYHFQYGILSEDGSGNDFGHEEERNGHHTRGMYRVLLPDGRLQVVTYTADKDGYRATVKYENVAEGKKSDGRSAGPVTAVQEPATSYGPPPPSRTPPSSENNNDKGTLIASAPSRINSYNARTSGSFVKLRRKINGQTFKYQF